MLMRAVQHLSTLVFEMARVQLLQLLMQRPGHALHPVQLLYYFAPACVLCMAVPCLALELPLLLASGTWSLRPLLLLASAAAVFVLNLLLFPVDASGLRTPSRVHARLGSVSRMVQPAPAAMLADVVTTALFTLVEAWPTAADVLPAGNALQKQRTDIAFFAQKS